MGDTWQYDWVCNNCSHSGKVQLCYGSANYCHVCWGLKEQVFGRIVTLEEVLGKGSNGNKGTAGKPSYPNRFRKGGKGLGDDGSDDRWTRQRNRQRQAASGKAPTESKTIKTIEQHMRGLQSVLGDTPELEAVASIARKRKDVLLQNLAPETRIQRAKMSVEGHQKNLSDAEKRLGEGMEQNRKGFW